MTIRARTQRNAGLTLIEMVVALVLASLMMAGLLRIVSSISIESNQMQREQTDYVAAGILADRLRTDLINARGILAGVNQITLAGYTTSQNRPGTTRYELVSIDGRRLLIRQSGQGRELCWVGFGGFEFDSYEEADEETPRPEMTGGLPPVPSRFRIGVRDAQGRLLFSEVIEHHALQR